MYHSPFPKKKRKNTNGLTTQKMFQWPWYNTFVYLDPFKDGVILGHLFVKFRGGVRIWVWESFGRVCFFHTISLKMAMGDLLRFGIGKDFFCELLMFFISSFFCVWSFLVAKHRFKLMFSKKQHFPNTILECEGVWVEILEDFSGRLRVTSLKLT